MGMLENIEGLKDARKRKGLSQGALALRAGLSQSEISNFESGGLSMGRAAAEKLASVLGSNPVTLQFENRARRLVAARSQGDAEGVFNAAKSAVKLVDGLEMDADNEKALDELVEAVLAFAESIGGKEAREAAESTVEDPAVLERIAELEAERDKLTAQIETTRNLVDTARSRAKAHMLQASEYRHEARLLRSR